MSRTLAYARGESLSALTRKHETSWQAVMRLRDAVLMQGAGE